MKKIDLLGSISALGILASVPALAEEATIETVEVTAARITANLDELPTSIGVISEEQIRRMMPNKLSDLFRYEPGVSIESSGHRHSDANINIRGIGGNRVLMIKDGVQMPEGFGSAGVSQGRGSFDPFSLQQVEVLKGPASALYGSNALGGVVIINTAKPKDLLDRSKNDFYASVNGGYFSEDKRPRVGATFATKISDSYLLVQGQTQQFEEVDVNSDFVANPKDGKAHSLTAKWQYESGSHEVLITADYFKQIADNILNTNVRPISGPPGTAVTEATAEDKSSRLHLGLQHKMSDLGFFDKAQWQVDYQYSNYKQYEFERIENPGSAMPPIPARNDVTEEWEDFKQKQISFAAQVEKELASHHFMFGVEGFFSSVERPVDKTLQDQIANTTSKVIRGIAHPGKTFPDADVSRYGAFLQDHMQLTENLKAIAGIRFDHFKNDPKPDEAFNNFNIAQAVPEAYSDSAFSPHLGLVFNASEEISLYGNYSAGFRTPPIARQYISRSILIPVPGVPHEVIPNNSLQSETSEGLEFGVRWTGEHARFSVAAYRNSYEDFIDSKTIGYRDAPPMFVGPTSIRQIQYQNVDKVRIEGLEFNANLMIGSILPDGWEGHVDMAASLIRGKNTETDIGLNSVPPSSAVIGVAISPDPDWQVHLHARIVGKAKDVEPLVAHGRPLPAFEPPAYATMDFTVQWQLEDKLYVNAAIYNLTDKKYWPASAKGDNASGNLDAGVAPGRNFAVSLSYQF